MGCCLHKTFYSTPSQVAMGGGAPSKLSSLKVFGVGRRRVSRILFQSLLSSAREATDSGYRKGLISSWERDSAPQGSSQRHLEKGDGVPPKAENLTPALVRTGFYPSSVAPRLGDLSKLLTLFEPFPGLEREERTVLTSQHC